MQLARVVLPWDTTESAVDALLNESELDFLQLDFVWPDRWQCDTQSDENLLSKWATGLLAQMRLVHKALFLRPELCVLTNAGGGNTVGGMEALAEFLSEHGSPEMPIAAVRGENLLSSLEWLPKGIDLNDRQILAAHAEIGGEPLSRALAEGARVVLTGAYDATAPFLAAATAGGVCGWHEFETLSNLAAASQFENVLVNFEGNGDTELAFGAEAQLARIRKLQIRENADVICDYSATLLTSNERNTLRISHVIAKPALSTWKVCETYDAGYRATALIETPHGVVELQEFCSGNAGAEEIAINEFAAEDSPSHKLVRVQYRGQTIRQCQQFVELLQSWLRHNTRGQFAEPFPSILHHTVAAEVRIPLDRIALSVETRPAREWL